MSIKFDLSKICTREQLFFDYMSISEESFPYIEKSLTYYFYEHKIPKRNKKHGFRIVWEIRNPSIKNTYKTLSRRLGSFFETKLPDFPHSKCFGYVKRRNIRENAKLHTGKKYILKADIKDFFPSITKGHIIKLFTNLGVSREIAECLSDFLTINEELVLGFPTSPVIANAIFLNIDRRLDSLASSCGACYSRYVDDLTFSSKKKLPEISSIATILAEDGFSLNNNKTRFTKNGQSHYVTGLSVSDSRRPRIPKKIKHNLRQTLFYVEKYGLEDHMNKLLMPVDDYQRYINHIDGLVKYVAFHEQGLARKIISLWYKILEENKAKVIFKSRNQNNSEFIFFIDETEFEFEDKKYLALGLSSSLLEGAIKINEITDRIKNYYIADPFSDGDKSKISKNGIHYSDASEDLKKQYIEVLQRLSFDGYIVYGCIRVASEYERVYLNLLKYIIKRRLIASKGSYAHFYFEENSKVKLKNIECVINDAWKGLKISNSHRPNMISCDFVNKTCYGISVPDFLLGVFRKYMMSDKEADPLRREHLMFERLRDKIRIIVNVDTGEEFTRRNPIKGLKH